MKQHRKKNIILTIAMAMVLVSSMARAEVIYSNIFFGDKDSVIRIINHILYVLYLKETNKRTHFPKTLDFFDFDKLTLPPLNIYFDSNKSEKTIIDINTIHSSKGLEYDCVISILPLEEIFNDSKYTDFRKYNDE